MRAPALRFALAGAVLFVAADRWLPAARSLASAGVSDTGGEDALLFNVALDARLDRSDPYVRYRLVTLGRFLGVAPETEPDAAVEQQARTLGLVHSDPIIRRHLIDLIRLTAAALPPAALPDEAELRRYYAAHADAYAPPDRRPGRPNPWTRPPPPSRRRSQRSRREAGRPRRIARGASVGPATPRSDGADFTTAVAPRSSAIRADRAPTARNAAGTRRACRRAAPFEGRGQLHASAARPCRPTRQPSRPRGGRSSAWWRAAAAGETPAVRLERTSAAWRQPSRGRLASQR